ncbi:MULTISPECIES: hypothetical protein [unclassified Phenylobacterium]|uniref:hypothetical protein n=1 Tax=unclassified Phenylobacterium TaxID=2640670 RepID=UPI0022B2BAA9|nr:hypothetical protein [Phenylobacterium sp. NIBR 498073]WGU40493.1 hypothetical protein O4N75_01900 [Phenylobacterium sp. NIBR 498073]
MDAAEGGGARIPAFSLSPYGFPIRLLLVAFALGVAYVVAHKINPYGIEPGCSEASRLLFELFDLNGENNVPTWFTALVWAMAAGLAMVASRREFSSDSVMRWSWFLLGGVFLLLSLDEVGSLHERLLGLAGDTIKRSFGLADSFYYSWAPMGMLAVILVAGLFIPFMLRIPRGVAARLILAAGVFLSGSLAIETIGSSYEAGWIASTEMFRISWHRLIFVEEVLEMIGAILAVHALLWALALSPSPVRTAEPSMLTSAPKQPAHG